MGKVASMALGWRGHSERGGVSTTRTICLKCGSNRLRWLTLRKGRIPVDVLQCQNCGTANAEEDWMPPLPRSRWGNAGTAAAAASWIRAATVG